MAELINAPDAGGSGGGTPPSQPAAPAAPTAPPPAAPAQTLPAESAPPAAPPAQQQAGDEADEWKGWWAGQLQKDTREKHRDGLLELKGKQLGEVFDDYFSNRARLKNAVFFPGKNAGQDEVDAFLKRMDIPKTSKEYGIDPNQIPGTSAAESKEAAANELAEFFRSIGLTKNQGKKMFESYAGMIKRADDAEAGRKKALADSFEGRLLKDIGDEKATTETKEYFKRALIALGDKQLVKELGQSGMLYSTAFVRGLADIWKAGNQEPPIPQAGPGRAEAPKDALPKGDQFNQHYGSRRK
jgi:hypothetical protein